MNTTRMSLGAMANAGADLIELGVPFSDPMADGPVIQRAMERALAGGARLSHCLDVVRDFREDHPDTPVVLFGYYNPIHRRGLETLCAEAAEAGVDGLLVVDLPPEAAADLLKPMRHHRLDFITLFTPTTGADRVQTLARQTTGFAYLVAVTGVTGGQVQGWEDLSARVAEVRDATQVPVAVGFGVRTPAEAARIARFADGVVVGSALIEAMAPTQGGDIPGRAGAFVGSLRRALDAPES
jgi:tryptophan synthase alpha chain